MSDELEKLRESIRKQAVVVKKLVDLKAEMDAKRFEIEQTETELPVQTEEPDQNGSPEPGS